MSTLLASEKKQFIKELCQDSFDNLHLQAIYLGSAHQDRVIATRRFLIHGRVARRGSMLARHFQALFLSFLIWHENYLSNRAWYVCLLFHNNMVELSQQFSRRNRLLRMLNQLNSHASENKTGGHNLVTAFNYLLIECVIFSFVNYKMQYYKSSQLFKVNQNTF